MVSSPSQKSWQLCILFQGVRKLVAASCHVCCLLLYSEVGQALFMHENTVRLRDWLYIHWPSHTGLWDWAALTLKSPDAQFGGFGLGTSLLTGLQTGFRLNPAWQLSSTCSKRPMENLKGLPKSKWQDAAFEKFHSGLGTTAFRLVGLVNEKQL